MDCIEELFKFLVVLLFQRYLRLYYLCYAFYPILAKVIIGLIQLISIAFDIVKNIIGSVLPFFTLLEYLQIYEFLILLINFIEAFRIEYMVELQHFLRLSHAQPPVLRQNLHSLWFAPFVEGVEGEADAYPNSFIFILQYIVQNCFFIGQIVILIYLIDESVCYC